jgi:cytoskeletal protein RodZ
MEHPLKPPKKKPSSRAPRVIAILVIIGLALLLAGLANNQTKTPNYSNTSSGSNTSNAAAGSSTTSQSATSNTSSDVSDTSSDTQDSSTGSSTSGQSNTSSCTPTSDEGTCYEPGEYCRDDDHGATGVAGDGESIVCSDNDGWRWEPN